MRHFFLSLSSVICFCAAGTSQRVFSSFLHSFVGTSHGGIPFVPRPLPRLKVISNAFVIVAALWHGTFLQVKTKIL